MPALRQRVDMALRDRPEHGGVIALSYRDLTGIPYCGGRRSRADALSEDAVEPAVNQPERLEVLLFDREPPAGRLLIGFEPIGTDQLVEVARRLNRVHWASRLA